MPARLSLLCLMLAILGMVHAAPEIAEQNSAPEGMQMICDEETGVCRLVFTTDTTTAGDNDATPPDASGFALSKISEISGFQSVADFGAWLDGKTDFSSSDNNILANYFKKYGLAIACLIAVFLGLALNLTPCVLPLIPVNLAIIGSKNATWRLGLFRGLLYGAGEAISFGLLGIVFVYFGGLFGSFTQTVWFNAAIALIFLVLALAMAGIFNIDFSRFRHSAITARPSVFMPLLLGAMNALLASACVAPVLLWVLLLATDLHAQGNMGFLLLPLMLGIGLGLPWPLLGTGLAFLPRPGRWMNLIKYAMAILIFVAAIYYGHAAWQASQNDSFSQPNTISLTDAIALSKSSGKNILIDFWGPACKNCDLMNATTLKHPEIQSRLKNYIFVSINAAAPQNQNIVNYFNIIGLPTYIIAK